MPHNPTRHLHHLTPKGSDRLLHPRFWTRKSFEPDKQVVSNDTNSEKQSIGRLDDFFQWFVPIGLERCLHLSTNLFVLLHSRGLAKVGVPFAVPIEPYAKPKKAKQQPSLRFPPWSFSGSSLNKPPSLGCPCTRITMLCALLM